MKLLSFFLKIAERSIVNAISRNKEEILKLLEKEPMARVIDLGCGGGVWHRRIMMRVGTKEVYGVDYLVDAVRDAHGRSVYVIFANLDFGFPLRDESFDVVISNQVIEHLIDVDNFLEEINRILKPNGCALISTENLSSFENLFTLLLGEQAFSQHISRRYDVGNRFSPHFSFEPQEIDFRHRTIFTYHGLQRLLVAYGFRIEKAVGVSTFPIPRFLSKLDPLHSRFITIKARKTSGARAT